MAASWHVAALVASWVGRGARLRGLRRGFDQRQCIAAARRPRALSR
ncbi:hypothetical protein GLA29479_140 [Lysobacter antibioticus]|nr:hypothetical protein GLA29479_140 [Lysobacter antibioticus]